MKESIRKLVAAAVVLVSSTIAIPVAAQDPSEEDLNRLRAEIAKLEQEVERQVDRRDDGMAELKTVEVSLAETRTELRSLAEAIDAQSKRKSEIAVEQREATDELASEQSSLAEQVRMSYLSGRQELIKLLLSQENPADFGRMMTYYNYMNRHRSERISAVNRQLARIEELRLDSDRVTRELESLRAEQEVKAKNLDKQRAERAALVAELNRSIESSGTRIEQMRDEEAALNEMLVRLAELLERFPISSDAPFAEQRGKLSWPVDGTHTVRFGDARTRDGRKRWSGELIEAETGTVVRAIYHGRVAVSNWVTGVGLLLMIDHGDGFVSYYGHNSVLLKEEGDWVEPGEAIAEVGDTGGQAGTGVLFGIARGAEFIDPARWIR
jgi:septal ring factor EnvC (AmiA/AmiB activator)